MLSKLAAIILGVLSEGPQAPEEISEVLKRIDSKRLFSVSDSAIFRTLKQMRKEGLISTPESKKTVSQKKHQITKQGEEELNSIIPLFLDNETLDPFEFDVAILLLYKLGKQKSINKLRGKHAELENRFYDIKKEILKANQTTAPTATSAILKHRLHLIEAKIQTIKELIKEVNTGNISSTKSPFK